MTPQKNIHGFGIDTFRRPSTSFSSLRALHHERFISHGKLVFRSWSLFGLSLVSLWSLFGLSLVSPCLSLVSLRSARRSQLLEDHTPKDKEQARPRIRLRRAQEEKKTPPSPPSSRSSFRSKKKTPQKALFVFSAPSSVHRWCLRFVRLPFSLRAFVPVVTSPSSPLRRFDGRRGGRGREARVGTGAAARFFSRRAD